jgi:Domain of Unknown Function (DUF1080)
MKFSSLALPLFLGLATLAARAADAPALPAADADGWITMFNGKDLSGWNGKPGLWSVKDGYITAQVDKLEGGNTFLIYDHPFQDFEMEAKFILVDMKGNSGIQYRSKVFDAAKWSVGGYQADIGAGWHGALYEERGRGILAKPTKETAPEIKVAEWNQYKIHAQGTKVRQEVNGKTTIEFDDQDAAKRPGSGVIALQYHAPGNFEVRFKDLRIRPLPAAK